MSMESHKPRGALQACCRRERAGCSLRLARNACKKARRLLQQRDTWGGPMNIGLRLQDDLEKRQTRGAGRVAAVSRR